MEELIAKPIHLPQQQFLEAEQCIEPLRDTRHGSHKGIFMHNVLVISRRTNLTYLEQHRRLEAGIAQLQADFDTAAAAAAVTPALTCVIEVYREQLTPLLRFITITTSEPVQGYARRWRSC